MLRLLLILVVLVAAGAFLWRLLKASQLGKDGGLSMVELRRMLKIAEKSKRMEAALMMRTRILGEAEKSNMQELSDRVDPVIRKLARQVELRDDIAVILSELDETKLAKEIRTAEAERADTKREQLETQLRHVKTLRVRRGELEEAGDRIIRELQNLHLALVNASATEAKVQLESGDVKSSLAHLEEASNELKSRAQAEDEIATLVRKSRAAGKVAQG
jgi:hypothetical protein